MVLRKASFQTQKADGARFLQGHRRPKPKMPKRPRRAKRAKVSSSNTIVTGETTLVSNKKGCSALLIPA